MDIEAIGTYYLNNSRYTSSLLDSHSNAGIESGSFSALVEEAAQKISQATKDETDETPVLSSGRKPVVDKTDKLYEQCEALETFLVKNLITGMRNTIQKSEFLSGGFAEKMYEDMLYDEYAKDFTKNARFGLAELAYLELTGQRGTKRSV
ncbi:MAG: rod-binding protein [Treponema sp.]|jgi:flagellar protein FlgJ|nr:rod-binding protein [Treponema sp.]